MSLWALVPQTHQQRRNKGSLVLTMSAAAVCVSCRRLVGMPLVVMLTRMPGRSSSSSRMVMHVRRAGVLGWEVG
jgi:hypothetical protein